MKDRDRKSQTVKEGRKDKNVSRPMLEEKKGCGHFYQSLLRCRMQELYFEESSCACIQCHIKLPCHSLCNSTVKTVV